MYIYCFLLPKQHFWTREQPFHFWGCVFCFNSWFLQMIVSVLASDSFNILFHLFTVHSKLSHSNKQPNTHLKPALIYAFHMFFYDFHHCINMPCFDCECHYFLWDIVHNNKHFWKTMFALPFAIIVQGYNYNYYSINWL